MRSARRLSHLRQLIFLKTTVRLWEQGALESMLVLQHLALDWLVTDLSTEQKEKHLRTFHCSREHAAFRRHLDSHPYLLTSTGQSLYDVAGFTSWGPYSLRDNFHPVDCARQDLTQTGNFETLTAINVPA